MKAFILFFSLFISLTGYAGDDLSNTKIEEFHKMINKKEAVGLDVRSSVEVKLFEANGSVHIPVGDLEERMGELDKSKTILVFCESGGRAGSAKNLLSSKGFKNVINVKDWRTWRKIRDASPKK